MPKILRDPVTGKAMRHNDKAALDENCAVVCCGGCWYPVHGCECDERPFTENNFYWRCEWDIEGNSFNFENHCYYIDTTATVTEIPMGGNEFPEGEIGSLTWFDDCEAEYDEEVQLSTGCCDPCDNCETECSSAYSVDLTLEFEMEVDCDPVEQCFLSCTRTVTVPITETSPPCGYSGNLELEGCPCVYEDTEFGESDFGNDSVSIVLGLHCDPPDNIYWEMVVQLMNNTEVECESAFGAHSGVAYTFRSTSGPCPVGTAWTLVSTATFGWTDVVSFSASGSAAVS